MEPGSQEPRTNEIPAAVARRHGERALVLAAGLSRSPETPGFASPPRDGFALFQRRYVVVAIVPADCLPPLAAVWVILGDRCGSDYGKMVTPLKDRGRTYRTNGLSATPCIRAVPMLEDPPRRCWIVHFACEAYKQGAERALGTGIAFPTYLVMVDATGGEAWATTSGGTTGTTRII